jgi:hypothetical protein
MVIIDFQEICVIRNLTMCYWAKGGCKLNVEVFCLSPPEIGGNTLLLMWELIMAKIMLIPVYTIEGVKLFTFPSFFSQILMNHFVPI